MWMEENLSDVMVCISALMAMMRMVVVSLLRSRADYTIGNITPVTSHAKNSHFVDIEDFLAVSIPMSNIQR